MAINVTQYVGMLCLFHNRALAIVSINDIDEQTLLLATVAPTYILLKLS
jgi:hypothetical protein